MTQRGRQSKQVVKPIVGGVLRAPRRSKKHLMLAFALLFAVVGSYLIINSFAATPSISSLGRIPWEGGPSYWKSSNGPQFVKADAAGWDDPNFFPISVYYGKADTNFVNNMLDAGINTYMAVEHDPANLPLTNATNAGMFVMPAQGEWTQAEVGSNSKAVGWFIADECDQGEGSCWANGDASARVPMQQAWVNNVKAYNDGRFTWANYGNGILRTFWATGTDMNQFVQMVDGSSADKYTYTSPQVDSIVDGTHDAPDWPNGVPVDRAYSYGWQADQMKRFQDPAKPHPAWTFVETARPYLNEANARTIALDQIEGAVWSALIHEARGIAYFQHNNSPTGCTAGYSIVQCNDVHEKVKAINAKVKSLAPVLNTQSYYNTTRTVNGYTYYEYSFNNGTDTMLKTYNNNAYIFAGLGMNCSNNSCTSGTADATGSKTFNLPGDVTGTTVTVVGENRTIPVVNGSFTDTFANEYTSHVYQVSMAATCDSSVSTGAALDSAVANLANSGKTICVTANISGSRNWTAHHTAMVKVVAQPNDMTIDMGPISFDGASNISVEGFDFNNGGIGVSNGVANIKILKNYFHDMNSDALMTSGATTNLEFSGNNVKCIAWTNVWTDGYGIRTIGGPNNGFKANYNTIDGCNNSADGMELGDIHNFEIIGNDIKNITYNGALPDPHADALMVWSDSSNGTIKDNRFSDSDDLLFNNTTDVLVENNLIVRMHNICHMGGPAGDSDNALRNFTWRKNTIYQCGEAWNSECSGGGNAWGANPPTTSCGYGLNSLSPAAGGAVPSGNILDRNLLVGFNGSCSQFTSANHNLVRTPFSCTGTNQGGFTPTFANTVDYLPTNLTTGYSDVGYRLAPYGHTAYDAVMSAVCDLNATTSNFASQISAATTGQTICLASGDYGTFTGTNKAITIKAADGANPTMKFNFASGDSGFTLDGLKELGGFINTGASNITIKNSTFGMANCWGTGCLQIEGAVTNIVIDNNDFTYATGTTCSGANSKIFTDTSGASVGSALKIINNRFANGDKDGVHVGGGSGLLVENNTFINMTDVNITCPGGGDSNHTDNIQFQGGTRINIRGNYVKSCDGCGTQGITSFDSGTDGIIIENNVVDIGRPWGIELYSDTNSIVRHNTVVWRADADCDFTGVECGMIEISRKTSDPVGSGTQVYDNITTRVDFNNSSTGTEHHNVSGKTAVYAGPLTGHDGFLLSASSPVGRNAASDGTNAGIYANGSTPPPSSDTTAPTVSMTAPTNSSTVSGSSVTVSANASDNIGVAGVQFRLDGANLGTEDTSAPYSISWDSRLVSNGSHTLTAIARDAAGNTTTATSVTVTTNNTTLCSQNSSTWKNTSITSQTGNFTFEFDSTPQGNNIDSVLGLSSGAATDYTSLAAIVLFNDQGFIQARNGSGYASASSIPYSAGTAYHFKFTVNMSNRTYSVTVKPNGGSETTIGTNYAFRTEQAAATSLNNWGTIAASGSQIICGVTLNAVADTTPPTVSMTAPANGATVSGSSVTISATASDNVGVAGVQFKMDGMNQGAEDTSSPYSTTWNTTTLANGTHTLTAVARDAAGNTTTATSITVTVNNVAPTPDVTAPGVPSGLANPSKTTSSVSLSWNASSDPTVSGATTSGINGYNVYRNGSFLVRVSSPTTTYTNSGLSASTSYSYQVAAVDNAGNESAKSSSISVTTSAAATSPPTAGPKPKKKGDVNGDNKVDLKDLSMLLSRYKTKNAEADFNDDTWVDLKDLSILLSGYGK